ncbi:myelin-oligodendrocyte glycoprotein isoform X11 [Theropithecus gelada]|uniref:MOG alpha-6 n=1 Tax=Macaca fascicularis TaxID=9541 RepID=Q29ZP3_MACFA|nr:myelin-oligodendrocyte glycoprotein isoform X10 [Macaca fascicularis]XP_025238851.1 myelin-oligodendrocyte glycoprotein isoform X11 [Theropithecus gelada]AAU10107.1 MOG alpha-6 [Macaca fascicularis]
MASLSRPSLPSCLCSFLLLLLLQVSSSYADPFYWVSPAVLVLLAVLPVLLLQITVGLVFLCLQYRLRGKLRAEIENLHRTFESFGVLGSQVKEPKKKGQFLEELRNPF